MIKSIVTPETLRKLLRCDPDKGFLFWRARPLEMFKDGGHSKEHRCNYWNSRYSGKRALNSLNGQGYLCGNVMHVRVRSHRVIWAMETGAWPVDEIDHENHIRTDNRFINLFEATHQENMKNQKIAVNNTSGITGVSFLKYENVWRAQIGVMNKMISLGNHKLKSDAIAARKIAELKYNFHTNHGVN